MVDEKHVFDEVGPIEFFVELVTLYGGKRAAQLVGYVCSWGVAGVEGQAGVLRFLQERCGLSRASAYRVLEDVRAFIHHLEVRHGWHGTMPDVVQEIRAWAVSQA